MFIVGPFIALALPLQGNPFTAGDFRARFMKKTASHHPLPATAPLFSNVGPLAFVDSNRHTLCKGTRTHGPKPEDY